VASSALQFVDMEGAESAMILNAFENRLRAESNTPCKQIQPLSRIKKLY